MKVKKTQFIGLSTLVILLNSISVNAQDEILNVNLTSLEEAWELAITENPDYQTYKVNQEKANADYKRSKSYLYPTVYGTFSGQKNLAIATTPVPGEIFGQPGQTVDAQFGQDFVFNAGISMSKDLFDRESYLQSEIAKVSTEISENQTEGFEQQLKEQVSLYYHTALVAKRAVEIGESDFAVSDSILVLTEHKYNEGLIDEISLNLAKINKNGVKQSLNSNRRLMNQCEVELMKLLGMSANGTLFIQDTIDYYLPGSFAVESFVPDPKVTSSILELEQSDLQVKADKWTLMPTLSINGYWGTQQNRENSSISFDGSAWTGYSYISLNLSVPIFTGFNNRSKIKSSKLNQQIAFTKKEAAVEADMWSWN